MKKKVTRKKPSKRLSAISPHIENLELAPTAYEIEAYPDRRSSEVLVKRLDSNEKGITLNINLGGGSFSCGEVSADQLRSLAGYFLKLATIVDNSPCVEEEEESVE